MALSSILSIGLHLTIFLFFYYGLPFSKIEDRKDTTIPLIFEEELQVSNKPNLKKYEKLDKPKKKKQINSTIENSPKPKPKQLYLTIDLGDFKGAYPNLDLEGIRELYEKNFNKDDVITQLNDLSAEQLVILFNEIK